MIAVCPIISLYSQNVFETPAYELKWPIGIALTAAAILWLLLSLIVRDRAKAGLVASFLVLFFFTITQVTAAVNDALTFVSELVWVGDSVHLWPPLVMGGEAMLCLALIYLVVVRLKWLDRLNAFANLFSIVAVLLPAFQIGLALWREPPLAVPTTGALAIAPKSGPRPDIYYIILDGFARADVQRALFDNDVEPFRERLRAKGFFVPRRSTANYGQTPLSLASSLNAAYLDGLFDKSARLKSPLRRMIGESEVLKALRTQGYRFNTFATGFDETEHPEADVYRSPYTYISGFHRLLLSMTPVASFLPNPSVWDSYTLTRARTLYLLDTLPLIARDRAPTFTFAHILAPHPPFVFGEDGEDVSPRQIRYYLNDGEVFRMNYGGEEVYKQGYRRQAIFLAKRVEQAIDRILAESPEPPIIILQSDHGSGSRLDTQSAERTDVWERFGILNAYYFPGGHYEALYDRISPVNSFRVVFNTHFGANLPLLPDRSYYSTWKEPFRFVDVTDRVAAGEPSGQGGR